MKRTYDSGKVFLYRTRADQTNLIQYMLRTTTQHAAEIHEGNIVLDVNEDTPARLSILYNDRERKTTFERGVGDWRPAPL